MDDLEGSQDHPADVSRAAPPQCVLIFTGVAVTDEELAAELAEAAGDLLVSIRNEGAETGKALGARGDREANALLLARLGDACPGDFILSEEARDNRARCAARRVWIIDPLDGTREYAEGREDWAVHVGLAIDGIPSCGAVALPGKRSIFSTRAAATASSRAGATLKMLVSRTRPPEIATRVATAIGAELVPMGSAGAKAMAVVTGEADVYLHADGQYEWDNCAPVAVARAHGIHASRLDGSALVYNCVDPLLPDLLICRPESLPQVRAAIDRELNPSCHR
jgi:3'(2'), 5'-bisphosphate nucleotidase